jgi:hypothetical protein
MSRKFEKQFYKLENQRKYILAGGGPTICSLTRKLKLISGGS